MREVTLHLESNTEAPGVARRHLRTLRSALEPRFDDVVLLVSELIANSVRHSDSHDIDLSVEAGQDQIRVEVTDDGPGITSVVDDGGGLGLQLVERLADDWGFQEGSRFTVWAEISKA